MTILPDKAALDVVPSTDWNIILDKIQNGTDFDIKPAGIRVASPGSGSGTPGDPWPGSDIQVAIDDLPATGGKVFVLAGTWNLDSLLSIPGNVWVEGSGKSTILDFTPASALTVAIQIQGFRPRVSNLRVDVNDNVARLMDVIGNGSAGVIDHILFNHPGGPIASEVGLRLDATTPSVYFWRIYGCEFIGFDIGLQLVAAANANYIWACHFASCNVGIEIDATTSLCMLSMITGQTLPTAVVDVLGDSNYLTDIWGEDNSGVTVRIQSGARFNSLKAVRNTGAGDAVSVADWRNRLLDVTGNPPGFSTTTPSMPATGVDEQNTNPYPVEVFITGAGTVTDYRITDVAGEVQTLATALRIGQTFTLWSGEKVRFTYTGAPTWLWKGL